jgi:hypothetical protein
MCLEEMLELVGIHWRLTNGDRNLLNTEVQTYTYTGLVMRKAFQASYFLLLGAVLHRTDHLSYLQKFLQNSESVSQAICCSVPSPSYLSVNLEDPKQMLFYQQASMVKAWKCFCCTSTHSTREKTVSALLSLLSS